MQEKKVKGKSEKAKIGKANIIKIALTKLEKKVLIAIRDNEYQDGSGLIVIDNPVWIFSVSRDVGGTKVFSGVMSSLKQKGFADTDGECCWITKEGINTLEEVIE